MVKLIVETAGNREVVGTFTNYDTGMRAAVRHASVYGMVHSVDEIRTARFVFDDDSVGLAGSIHVETVNVIYATSTLHAILIVEQK